MKMTEIQLGMKVRIPAGQVGEVVSYGEGEVEVDLGGHNSIYKAAQLTKPVAFRPARGYFR